MSMDPRLHHALDDELQSAALPPAQRAELDDARALFDAVVDAIPSRPLPPLGAAVLRRISEAEAEAEGHAEFPAEASSAPADLRVLRAAPRRDRGFAAWLWSPHQLSLSVRPAYALAAAALLAVVVGLAGIGGFGRRGDAITAARGDADILVEFRLDAPTAHSVTLAGDFSNWSPAHTMQRSASGVWTIVVPLAPGVHEYAFVVDGERWVADPAAPPQPDGFGGINSRLAVLAPDPRS